MITTANDARATAQSAVNALHAGRNAEAQALFEEIVNARMADASVFLGLAIACFRQGDTASANGAADFSLKLEPRNLRALIVKADIAVAQGNDRVATSFFQAAVHLGNEAGQLPPDLAADVARAKEFCDRIAGEFEQSLRSHVSENVADDMSPRFAESIDVMFGKKQIFPQEPRYYYFPGLAPVTFFDTAQFGWIEELERAAPAIRAELRSILQRPEAFSPYVVGDPNRPHRDTDGMTNNPAWGAYYLWKNGELQEEAARRCPETIKALEKVPLAVVPNRSPSVLFSLLRPGAHIPPHNGLVNTRLICHLPLIVPERCEFRVGNDVRQWQQDKVWVFDDSINHEAWNRSDSTRVILLFEVWRPEITAAERDMVVKLFDAIDRYSLSKQTWDI